MGRKSKGYTYEQVLEKSRQYGRKVSLARFGMTLDEYKEIVNKIDNVCPICRIKSNKPLVIDHCHKTNKFRGFICGHCNTGLGMFRDNVDSLKSAVSYLELSK